LWWLLFLSLRGKPKLHSGYKTIEVQVIQITCISEVLSFLRLLARTPGGEVWHIEHPRRYDAFKAIKRLLSVHGDLDGLFCGFHRRSHAIGWYAGW
jgi:hypothetical protein